MNKSENEYITASNFCFFLIGSLVGTGILKLPNDIVRIAKQDGWIAIIIGGIYPIYVVVLGNYIIKKYPQVSILGVSKQCMGKVIGTIFNIIYLIECTFILVVITCNLKDMSRIFTVSFLTSFRITIVAIFLAAYTSYKGLRVLGEVSKYTFFLTMALLTFSAVALKYGKFINIQPILGTKPQQIVKGVEDTFLAYTYMEFLILFHPCVKNKDKIKKYSFIAAITTIFIYTYVVFITTYYLGIDTIQKLSWSFVSVTESIHIPIVNNFRYIFMFLWNIIIFRNLSNNYYSIVYVANDIFKVNKKKLTFIFYPIIIVSICCFKSSMLRRELLDFIMPKFFMFNIVYVTLVAALVFFKNKSNNKAVR